jgi:hypothetical protein
MDGFQGKLAFAGLEGPAHQAGDRKSWGI